MSEVDAESFVVAQDAIAQVIYKTVVKSQVKA
jgi:hypothetical protein